MLTETLSNTFSKVSARVVDYWRWTMRTHPWLIAPGTRFPLLADGNIAILGSMTKDHALAGLRLGYLVAGPPTIARVVGLQPAWSVNAVAQSVGVAALEDDEHVAAARRAVLEAKEYLYSELSAAGIPVTPSAANFILVEVGDAPKVRSALLSRGFAVRDCTSFGLPDHIRVAVRVLEECARLLEALRETLSERQDSNIPTLAHLYRVPIRCSSSYRDRPPVSFHRSRERNRYDCRLPT